MRVIRLEKTTSANHVCGRTRPGLSSSAAARRRVMAEICRTRFMHGGVWWPWDLYICGRFMTYWPCHDFYLLATLTTSDRTCMYVYHRTKHCHFLEDRRDCMMRSYTKADMAASVEAFLGYHVRVQAYTWPYMSENKTELGLGMNSIIVTLYQIMRLLQPFTRSWGCYTTLYQTLRLLHHPLPDPEVAIPPFTRPWGCYNPLPLKRIFTQKWWVNYNSVVDFTSSRSCRCSSSYHLGEYEHMSAYKHSIFKKCDIYVSCLYNNHIIIA